MADAVGVGFFEAFGDKLGLNSWFQRRNRGLAADPGAAQTASSEMRSVSTPSGIFGDVLDQSREDVVDPALSAHWLRCASSYRNHS